MFNSSLSFNFNAIRTAKEGGINGQNQESNDQNNPDFERDEDSVSNNIIGYGSNRKFGQSKIGVLSKMNSSVYNFGGNGGGNQFSGNESFFSYGGKSQGTVGGGLASKISMALSRIVYNRNNSMNDDDDVADLIQLIEELNQHNDLTVKLNNQSKICKILETNDEF